MEPLSDPLKDRAVPALEPPPAHTLSSSLLFPNNKLIPDLPVLKQHLSKEGKISKPNALSIITQCSNIFSQEKNLLELNDPITIIGDIHGQYYDLLNLLDLSGPLPSTKYLFLGDYVNRGSFSVEVILLLYSLKINYPFSVYLLRGHHESRLLTDFFNFREECLHKYDLEFYDAVLASFFTLPLACLVNKKFLAVHGGLSPELKKLEDIEKINRFSEIPSQGLFCDIMWSDPLEGLSLEKFRPNELRECGFYYGHSAVNSFLKKCKLLSLIRSHEVEFDGYKMHKWNGVAEFPVVITVFSAPNYCDAYNNKAAILKIVNNNLDILQFNYTIHPYVLPGFSDVFAWSLPYIMEKIVEICYSISVRTENSDPEDEGSKIAQKKTKKSLKAKIEALVKMKKMLSTLREDNELIFQLKSMCPDKKIPRGLLLEGRDGIAEALQAYKKAKLVDSVNEKNPFYNTS